MSLATAPLPIDHAASPSVRRAVAAVVVLLHAGLLAGLWLTETAPARPEEAVVMVSFVADAAPAAPVAPPSPPPSPREVVRERPPVLATERQLPAEAAPARPPEAPVVPDAATPPVVAVARDATPGPVAAAPAAATAPSFGAAYLRNPRPAYPALSRRLGEQGTTYLRVQVNAEGRPQQVMVERGSGFDRLDRAAQAAVRDWRFVPAREGDKAVTGWVTVPISWRLEN